MRKLQLAVLMGGPSPEHEVSLISGRQVVKHLSKKKYEVFPILIPKKNSPLKWIRQIITLKLDVVFIAIHGPFGEDGTIQGMLELLRIPYTGAGVLASALGMNKLMFRKLVRHEGIPTPEYLSLEKGEHQSKVWKKFSPPVVVKPCCLGSSIGVSIVRRKKGLEKALALAFSFDDQIIIDKYIKGTEIACGILGNDKPITLPLVEIVPKKEFFDYEAKYNSQKSEEIIPARISLKLTRKIQDLAIKVYKIISCRGFARVDMIISENKPYVLEINTIPGLTPVSLFPKQAAATGISYPNLLDCLINLALEKE